MRVRRRQEHLLFGAEDLGALAHKGDAAKDDNGFSALLCLAGERKTVAHEIRRRLHGVGHIIVSEDERVLATDGLTGSHGAPRLLL